MVDWSKDFFEPIFCNRLLDELKAAHLIIGRKDLLISELRVEVSNNHNEVEALKKALNNERNDFGVSIVTDLYNQEDLKPTQSDKPSPHSSLTFAEAIGIAKEQFKEPRHKLFSIQNTNSMEPFLMITLFA